MLDFGRHNIVVLQVGRGESGGSVPDVNASENWEYFAFGVKESWIPVSMT
jgi:hypothetical protein